MVEIAAKRYKMALEDNSNATLKEMENKIGSVQSDDEKQEEGEEEVTSTTSDCLYRQMTKFSKEGKKRIWFIPQSKKQDNQLMGDLQLEVDDVIEPTKKNSQQFFEKFKKEND